MRETYRYNISGRELFVIDNVFSKEEVRAIAAHAHRGPAYRRQGDRRDTRKNLSFAAHYDRAGMLKTFVGERITELMTRYFPNDTLLPSQFYSNLGYFGDSAYPHRDCPPWSKGVTALVYPNPKWDVQWGGETLFYNDEGDAVTGVTPRPGRVALFRAAMMHRPGLVSRECYAARLTLACKFGDPSPPPAGERVLPRPPSARPVCAEHNSRYCGCQEKLASVTRAPASPSAMGAM